MRALQAENPAVVYSSGGVGDHLLALPALRALASLFPDRLKLVCVPGTKRMLFSELRLREIYEVETFDKFGKGIVMNLVERVHSRSSEEAHERAESGADAVIAAADPWDPWTFDVKAVAQLLSPCDLLISLTPWHSPAADVLLHALRPEHSIGFSPLFETSLPPGFHAHAADVHFAVPQCLFPALRVEEFVGHPIAAATYYQRAQQIRRLLPASVRVLGVHTQTKAEKMWCVEGFVRVIDAFLESHSDFVALVVSYQSQRLDTGTHGGRVLHCHSLDLGTALALVGGVDLFLGVDSCMLHAADLGFVPGVGIFGPTNSDTWGFRFAAHKHLATLGTTTESVVEDAVKALNSLLTKPSDIQSTRPRREN